MQVGGDDPVDNDQTEPILERRYGEGVARDPKIAAQIVGFNVAKHARASQVRVVLGHDAATVSLPVEDDGRGFDPKVVVAGPGRWEGIGLLGLRERLELVDGRLEIVSQLGQGTRLVAQIPWEGNG